MKKYKKIICFDLDGVIAITEKKKIPNYKKSRPIKEVIKNINQLYKNNYKIIIFTSRFMGRNNDNIKHAYNDGYEFTKRQLMNWGVNFHRLIFGKPSYDLYVDDKSIFFRNDWIKLLKKKINK